MNITVPTADPSPISVAFSLVSPGARTVFVAIFFNQWSADLPVPKHGKRNQPPNKDHLMVRQMVGLEQTMPGQWRCEVLLAPGWHEYLFVVDGAWVMDPAAPEVCPDCAGGFNAALMVGTSSGFTMMPRTEVKSGPGRHRPSLRSAI